MNLKQELIDRLGVPENWDKHDYQTQRYSFEDMQEVLEDIMKMKLLEVLINCQQILKTPKSVTIKELDDEIKDKL